MATALTANTHPQHASLIAAARSKATAGQPRHVSVTSLSIANDLAATLRSVSGVSAVSVVKEGGHSDQYVVDWTES